MDTIYDMYNEYIQNHQLQNYGGVDVCRMMFPQLQFRLPFARSAACSEFDPLPNGPRSEHFGYLHTSGKVSHFRTNHNVQKMPKALQASNSYIESLLFFHFLLDFLSLLLREVPWLATAQGSHAQRNLQLDSGL